MRLGLPEARVFQAALPITPANQQHTPQNFFLEAVQATNVRAEDRIVELVKVELGRPPAGLRGRFAPQRGRIVDRDDVAARRRVWTDRAGARGALPRGRVSPEAAARLEVVRSFLPG